MPDKHVTIPLTLTNGPTILDPEFRLVRNLYKREPENRNSSLFLKAVSWVAVHVGWLVVYLKYSFNGVDYSCVGSPDLHHSTAE